MDRTTAPSTSSPLAQDTAAARRPPLLGNSPSSSSRPYGVISTNEAGEAVRMPSSGRIPSPLPSPSTLIPPNSPFAARMNFGSLMTPASLQAPLSSSPATSPGANVRITHHVDPTPSEEVRTTSQTIDASASSASMARSNSSGQQMQDHDHLRANSSSSAYSSNSAQSMTGVTVMSNVDGVSTSAEADHGQSPANAAATATSGPVNGSNQDDLTHNDNNPGPTGTQTQTDPNLSNSTQSVSAEPLPPPQLTVSSETGLIVVSNRLPVTIKADPKAPGGYTFTGSSGGLVSALGGCKKQMSFTWIGWPGLSVASKEDEEYIEKRLKEEYSCTPVWISDEIADRHYNGFSNSILWPLFHYHPGEMNFDEANWLAYREANLMFAEKVRSVVKKGDMVWVQDYHLMLLPLMLRTLIEGSGMQGWTSQRELEHVRRGVDGTSRLEKSEALAAPIEAGIRSASRRESTTRRKDPNSSPTVQEKKLAQEMKEDRQDEEDEETESDNEQTKQHQRQQEQAQQEHEDQERSREGARARLERANAAAQKAEEDEIRRGQGKGTSDGASARGAIKIGFFLHTPFPSSEIYRILPVRREILLGILHSDLIGFHTYDYARHFLSSCTRILGLPTMPNGAEFEGRYVHVGAYPIGIEPSQFHESLQKESVKERVRALERRFEGVKIIVGIDRLDYIKGVPQKLLGLETFLQQHPEWIGKVVLVQVAVPSRQDVEEYQNLRASVNETVGRINGHFGTVESMPIHFLHRSVPFDELCALYAVSDACLVTSTRDGMNLVSYEYIASQNDRKGVMILSEFAGAAQSLNGSLIINPWDKFATADAIHEALTMPIETRTANFEKLRRYVNKHTSAWWGVSFVNDLGRIQVSMIRSESPHTSRRTNSVSLFSG